VTRRYRYVGPADIKKKVEGTSPGVVVRSPAELDGFLRAPDAALTGDGLLPLTFVVGTDGELRIADRHSEHVACAGGGEVLSAGELFIAHGADGVARVEETSNQSTGYCPEPSSWSVVASALDCAHVSHPGRFTREITFRLCPKCHQRNIVKDGWFVCALCDASLPDEWNF
jgi:hypothetical protein